MNVHLAILYKEYLDLILEGKKTIEARFSRVKSPPFGRIKKSDKILLKETGGSIKGEAIATEVKYYEDLTPDRIMSIVNIYRKELQIKENFLKQKINSKYLTLIFLGNVRYITPYSINKKDRRAWIIIENQNQRSIFDFGKVV